MIEATGLHFSGAVAEIALASLHEGGTLLHFMAGVMAGVSGNAGCQDRGDGERSEEFHFEVVADEIESRDWYKCYEME